MTTPTYTNVRMRTTFGETSNPCESSLKPNLIIPEPPKLEFDEPERGEEDFGLLPEGPLFLKLPDEPFAGPPAPTLLDTCDCEPPFAISICL